MNSDLPRISKPEKTGLVAVATNTVLTAIKFILALLTGSLALLAEAFHSLADIGSSLAVFLALWAERKDPDASGSKIGRLIRRNPQRKVAIFIGVFLLCVAISIFRKVFQPAPLAVAYPVPAALTMLVLALFSFLLSRLERTVGEKTGSTALIADGIHARVDMFGSLLVAIALLGESLSLRVDRLAAGIISFFILLQAINVFVTVVREYLSKEKQEAYFYPQWLMTFSQKSFPRFKQRLYVRLARLFRIASESPDLDRRVGRILTASLLVLAFAIYLSTGLFTVKAHQQAIVERFGRPLQKGEPLNPGLHYCLPWPVDKVRKVDSMRVRRIVVGSELAPDSKVLLWTNIHYIQEFNVLSGENIFMDVSMILQYRIVDPYTYLYAAKSPETTLRELGYAVLLRTTAHRIFFELVTTDRDHVEDLLMEQIANELAHYDAGLELISVNLRDLHPPTNVAPDFEEVVSATVDFETYINEAHGYANDLIPRARGQAEVIKHGARANRKMLKLRGKGESESFLKIWDEYRKAPWLNRRRLLLETMDSVLAGKEKYIVPPEAAEGAVDLFLIMNPSETKKASKESGESSGGIER
jgi:membrane protease subunit HflK